MVDTMEDRSLFGQAAGWYAGMYFDPKQAALWQTWRGLSAYQLRIPGLLPAFGWKPKWTGSKWASNILFGGSVNFRPAFHSDAAISQWAVEARRGYKKSAPLERMIRRESYLLSRGPATRATDVENWLEAERVVKGRVGKVLEQRFQKTFLARSAKWIAGIGTPMNILMTSAGVYMLGKWVAEKSMQKAIDATNTIGELQRSIATLELGGQLPSAYLSTEAATERQRALQAIQSSHLSGRRWLGSEANFYH